MRRIILIAVCFLLIVLLSTAGYVYLSRKLTIDSTKKSFNTANKDAKDIEVGYENIEKIYRSRSDESKSFISDVNKTSAKLSALASTYNSWNNDSAAGTTGVNQEKYDLARVVLNDKQVADNLLSKLNENNDQAKLVLHEAVNDETELKTSNSYNLRGSIETDLKILSLFDEVMWDEIAKIRKNVDLLKSDNKEHKAALARMATADKKINRLNEEYKSLLLQYQEQVAVVERDLSRLLAL